MEGHADKHCVLWEEVGTECQAEKPWVLWDAGMGADPKEPEGCLEGAAVLCISCLFKTRLIN